MIRSLISFPGWRQVRRLQSRSESFVLRGAASKFIPSELNQRLLKRIIIKKAGRGEPYMRSLGGKWVWSPDEQRPECIVTALASWSASGYTLVLNDLASEANRFRRAQHNVEHLLNIRLRLSAFLSERSVQGFDCHYDAADFFAVQMQGAKLWKVYERVMRHPDQTAIVEFPHRSPRRVHLRAGDVLFLRQGTVHQVRNLSNSTPSLHIAMSIYCAT